LVITRLLLSPIVISCLKRNLRVKDRVSVNAQMDVLHPLNRYKTSKIIAVIAISNEYISKLLGQDVSIRPLFENV